MAGPVIGVQVTGTRELMATLNKIKNIHKSPRLNALCHDAGEAYRILAWQSAPKDTRMLCSSIGYRVENFGTPQLFIRIGFDERASRWAQYVEFGSGPSVRTPRTKRWMHWFTAGPGGKTIQQPWGLQGQDGHTSNFAKKVNHPGTKPQPFFFQHMPLIRDRFIQGISNLINDELRSAGSK